MLMIAVQRFEYSSFMIYDASAETRNRTVRYDRIRYGSLQYLLFVFPLSSVGEVPGSGIEPTTCRVQNESLYLEVH